ncbi:MAG: RnfABCDGE type electron transport complex subunit B [Candidatus Sedimenticola endophacoides]|uniref:Ion-translocating oxidoreductase complex subunit B n=1 Tax=Candidatus Sedimenticola endophacoides TaxID=2548426 RepID=A0A657PPY8_9GAMM|nr:MAG: Fe-S cluster protein [Candidatus Sedimenticola endophacoides]OQX34928.1 MAG: Fe-S cluster protein [Candidatus Sedimenticola endophacoides]OQX38172.1 MAG: Fe-S cluster protein [Candidatus Sedimenticola endophacoides]OQX40334.1 MAG: Fe-S cluster protein [Candidatus Sedimenticola endophacoides]OQX43355.1 MAG: Fe-S cluster protein [Candidatus Sedimenticola endophacoides]
MSLDFANLITAPAVMTGIGLFFGIILASAARLFRVDEDPRVQQTEEMLPGTNCGACGEPGCAPFAEAVVRGRVQLSKCTVASPDMIDDIAAFLGVEAGQQERRIARLHCAGGHTEAHQIAEYRGFDSCAAAAVISGGGKGCSWGCLGLADCAIACTFEVIHMNPNGLPVVESDGCTACGDCVEACPRDLFEIVAESQRLFVQCATPLDGEAATHLCSVACDACARCAADAPPGLIEMRDNLPRINYTTGLTVSAAPTRRCPTGAIRWIAGNQFTDSPAPRAREGQRHA